ncbi:helix-turn-helix transcriptional regulator [Aquabacterium sp.]|uniref:helix-turn-helix transcriptional regulator n=1 Tax=Aquabacterium sp. TaxID=1872578 RepID=UPI0025B97881|nr:helix-turn-helix transcriptional regulator [Aquabacterium sp.]
MSVSVHHPRYVALRNHLKAMREAAGMTQNQLADALGVTQSFVSKIERGERYVDVLFYMDWCRSCAVEPDKAMRSLERLTA